MDEVGRRAHEEPLDVAGSTVADRRADLVATLWFAVVMVVAVAWAIAVEPIACAAVSAPVRYPCPTGPDHRQVGAAVISVGAAACGLAATFGWKKC
ncbi:hypothetical protein [Pseudactinotalea terrae]|uniref:hypothetical protein n=1 Tax=Pseudactinotalea terrae TaxID=1743262 RepID=UPI0012E11246|nr:hypothetical protein [Pseudactinotalea terrae]